jgi:hypothetical protein
MAERCEPLHEYSVSVPSRSGGLLAYIFLVFPRNESRGVFRCGGVRGHNTQLIILSSAFNSRNTSRNAGIISLTVRGLVPSSNSRC